MHMAVSVAIAGASGYAGSEALRLLLAHPQVEVGKLTAHSNAGDRVGAHHPHLPAVAERTFGETTAEELQGHDVVLLALPHGASTRIAAQLRDAGSQALILDCGADHRLWDPQDWQAFYGTEHAGSWPYGMPELFRADLAARQRQELRGAQQIAVPGCNVTAVTLGMQPGIAAGVVEAGDVVAMLAAGYSGAGKSLKPHLLAAEGLNTATPYAVGGQHRHVPEIEQNLRSAGASAQELHLSFTPVLVPMSRGILATTTAPLAPGTSAAQVRAAWAEFYADEPFVHLLPEGQWPTTAATAGANTAHVQVAVDERAGRVVSVCAIDNLTKGTAGAAVQSMNLALDWPEDLGLPTEGVAP